MSERALWSAVLALFGAIIGSFVAALVTRWPEGRSVAAGRSTCDACGRMLRAVELIPLVSAAVQWGRCRGCGGRIDPVHWWVEAGAVAVGASAGWVAPDLAGVSGAAFGWMLLALAALDLRAFWLPDRLTGLLALGGVAAGAAGLLPEAGDRVLGGAAGFGLLWGVARAYRLLRGREGMGGGDPKLFGAIGLWLGWRMLPAVLLTAGLLGLGVVAWRAATGRAVARDDALPLGTLLAIAAYPAWWMMIGLRP